MRITAFSALRTAAFALVLCSATMMAVSSARAFPPTCPESTGPDVMVGEIANNDDSNPPSMTNYPISSGAIEVFSVGTYSCNAGTQRVNWHQTPNSNHPVIGQNCYRLKDVNGSKRFEQLGQSWLKHGFFALSDTLCCTCTDFTDGSQLGVGCSDPYNSDRNGGQGGAGPKWQVNATTGVHIQPIANPFWSGIVARRLQVKISDLEVSDGSGSTKYFAEGQYVAADDAANGTKNNNASYRLVQVSGGLTNWEFAVSPTYPTHREQPAIQAWADNEHNVSINYITTPEDANANPNLTVAQVILAGKATLLVSGLYHYEYAIQNLNSDRSIGSFGVPVSIYANVTNIGFHDVNYHDGDGIGNVNRDGTDWPGVFSGGNVSWATVPFTASQNLNAIRWGTLYNFRFDCDLAPTTGNATLGQYKTVNDMSVSTVVPTTVTCLPGDMNNDGIVDGGDIALFSQRLVDGNATPREKCAGDRGAVPDGKITVDDVDGFSNCVLASGC